MAEVNSEWEGNYKVRYWDPEWQAIILEYVKKIAQAGFDGLYMDVVDAWEYWKELQDSGVEVGVDDPAIEMAKFIHKIHQEYPNMKLIPQNGEEIISFLPDHLTEQYLADIFALAVEDLYYSPDGGEYEWSNSRQIYIHDNYIEAGIPVLVVDYVKDLEVEKQFIIRASRKGFIPFAALSDRLLNRIETQ